MNPYQERQASVFEKLPSEVTEIALTPGPSLKYLTGYQFDRTAWGEESPFICIISRDEGTGTVLPDLETEQAEGQLQGSFYTYTNEGFDPAEAVENLTNDITVTPPIGVDMSTMRLQESTLLDFNADKFVDISGVLSDIRSRKDEIELEIFQEAAKISDEILGETLNQVKPGVKESTLETTLKIKTLESEADAFGSGVVTSGPRTAINYTETTDRQVSEGDVVLIDMGIVYEGYYTDVTRTVAVGTPEQPFPEIHETVRQAAASARKAAKPGMTAGELDQCARDVIEEAGYGSEFVTGLGHGIGLDSHEKPILEQDNDAVLEEGNVVTIEPGIYIKGTGGVRIEDNIALTDNGSKTLTSLDRTLTW